MVVEGVEVAVFDVVVGETFVADENVYIKNDNGSLGPIGSHTTYGTDLFTGVIRGWNGPELVVLKDFKAVPV